MSRRSALLSATVFALVVQLTVVTSLPASVMSLVVWAEFAVALALPFFFSGIVVSLALTRSSYPVGIVYGVDLVGAALGCLGALALLNVVVAHRRCSGSQCSRQLAACASPEWTSEEFQQASRLPPRSFGIATSCSADC